MGEGTILAPPGSPLRGFAEAIGWLWRVEIVDDPGRDTVVLAGSDDADAAGEMLAAEEVAAAVVLSARPGPDSGILPGRSTARGAASIPGCGTIAGSFTILHGPGEPVVESSLGVHGLRTENVLALGYDPGTTWGTLHGAWALPALASFLSEILPGSIAKLPPIGVVRFDDVPGTADQQLQGTAKSDRRVSRRLERQLAAYRDAGAKLNLAVTCRGLVGKDEVPADDVWPQSIAALADAISEGVAEQVCHGYLHLEGLNRPGAPEPREFAHLDRVEAARRIAVAIDWAEAAFGRRPASFVAPNWGYSEATLAELADLGMPAWRQPRLGPIVDGNVIRETLVSTLDGLSGVDYAPLEALAACGMPPTVTVHGGLIDGRRSSLRLPRDAALLARLAVRRDLTRLASLSGVRWVTASELIGALRAHGRSDDPPGEAETPPSAPAGGHG